MARAKLLGLALIFTIAATMPGCGEDFVNPGPGSTNAAWAPTFVQLTSDAGDFVGQGWTYLYTNASAMVTPTASGGRLALGIRADQQWNAVFQLPIGVARFQPASYTSAYPFQNPHNAGLEWFGESRDCATVTGSFTVDSARYAASALSAIHLRFEQHCNGALPALRGTVHWYAADTTRPPGPVTPIPAELWHPEAGAVPAGNSLYLVSEAGDYVGAGSTYTFTSVTVTTSGGHVSVRGGDWSGEFETMYNLTQVQLGYYPGLTRYPFDNPARGGLSWFRQGRDCAALTGWVAVDGVAYAGADLTALDLRFEQHCEGSVPALHGALHWRR